MAKQTFTTGQVLTAAQVNSLQSNDFNQTVSVKTAAYVLAAADKGTRIEFNTSGAVTCTVNTGLFDAGDTVIIQNRGAGDVTVTAGTATVDTAGSLVLSQYQSGTLYFISASASIFFAAAVGDLTAVTSGTGISITNAGGPVPTITNSMATTIDAKGDLIVGTGSDAFTRLPVSSTNGWSIVADSSETTGLKWQAASSGGMTLLSTTTLSGASTTISSISDSYNALYIMMYGITNASNTTYYLSPNDTGSITSKGFSYYYANPESVGTSGGAAQNGIFPFNYNLTGSGGNNTAQIWIYDYASSSNYKPYSVVSYSNTKDHSCEIVFGGISTNTAISSLKVYANAGSMTAGTVKIYGVK